MKKISLLAFVLMLNISLFAQNVAIEEAQNVAKNYMLMQRGNSSNALVISEQNINYSQSGEILSYIFNFEGGGFVIVSGDKRVTPVLAFSLSNTFPVNNKNHPASIFVEGYGKAIEQIKMEKAKMEISPKWNELATGRQHKKIITTVGPLVTSTWNQDKFYNTLCPDEGSDVAGTATYDWHVPNGCVAVAMAQIMYYHRHPRKGNGQSSYSSNYGLLSANYGETIYDYEAMGDVAKEDVANRINGYSDAIARLIFHAGVSVKMNYEADGSGSFSEDAQKAFSQRFLYNTSSVIQGGDNPDNTKSWWKDTIRQSIDKKMPVYYAACKLAANESDPDGCHAFICDGYQIHDTVADMFFHFNFGWGGKSNGFYKLAEIHDAYLLNSRIIINIEPKTYDNFFTGQDTLTATYGSFNDGSGRLPYKENTNCSWLIFPQDGRNVTKIELKVASFSLADGDSVKIYAGNSESDPLVATLSGDIAQNTIYTVNSPQALVVFTSDASLNGDGFTFNYTSTKTLSNYCSTSQSQTRITTKEGSIDNGSGTADYDSDNTCYWAIAPTGMGSQVKLAFSHFDLGQGDVIEIFAYPNTTSPIEPKSWPKGIKPERRFSNDNKPDLNSIYTIAGPTALISFRTDNKGTATGFRIYWRENMNIQENNFGLAQLSIYPNPANDNMKVSLTTEQEENVQITVYDILGKVMYSVPPMQISGQHEENIDVSNFAQGLYLLRISTSKGIVTRKMLVE